MNLGQREALRDLAHARQLLLDQVDVIDRVLAVFGVDDVLDLRDPARDEAPATREGSGR